MLGLFESYVYSKPPYWGVSNTTGCHCKTIIPHQMHQNSQIFWLYSMHPFFSNILLTFGIIELDILNSYRLNWLNHLNPPNPNIKSFFCLQIYLDKSASIPNVNHKSLNMFPKKICRVATLRHFQLCLPPQRRSQRYDPRLGVWKADAACGCHVRRGDTGAVGGADSIHHIVLGSWWRS